MSRDFTAFPLHPPRSHLLSAGDWTMMLTPSGTGFSRWRGLAINRWRGDALPDASGSFLLLRDGETGTCWSATAQPLLRAAEGCSASFDTNRARFTRREGDIASLLELAPLPDGTGELRRLTLSNDGPTPRQIDATSYLELILGAASADAAHPAFSRMFVQTEALEPGEVLLAWRRKRDPAEPDIFAAHLCSDDDAAIQVIGYETDRMRFLGRNGNLHCPAALTTERPATRHSGAVLDPIFSLRRRITLAPGGQARLCFWTVVAQTRAAILALADRCRLAGADDAVLTLGATDAAPLVAQFQTLTAPLLLDDPAYRAPAALIAQASGGAPACLWPHGISGDRPIILVRMAADADPDLLRQLQAAQSWWSQRQLAVDLVVIAGTGGLSRDAVMAGLAAHPDQSAVPPCGLFVLDAAILTVAAQDGLAAAARIVLSGENGDLTTQINRIETTRAPHPLLQPSAPLPADPAPHTTPLATDDLEFFNGLGGFTAKGREYEIHLQDGVCTPQPWVNILANADFGCMISAEGGGYAWAGNSQTNTLTPWSNDATADPPGDVLYLRDTDSARLWSATPQPIRTSGAYRIRHGFGYSRFGHDYDGIASDLVQFVPLGMSVKISRLRLENRSGRVRRLQIIGFVNWMLDANGASSLHHVVTACDDETGMLTARNGWRADYHDRLAFADLGANPTGWTCDRTELLGNGGLDRPAALLSGAALQARAGAGLRPCAALQTTITLAAGARTELVFLLGEAADLDAARKLVAKLRAADPQALLDAVKAHWHAITDRVQIKTPDRGLDLMVNGWLPYQIIACRLDARTAFYQASGAYGFRDQLQDVAALALTAPDLVRAHLIRAAGRQFPEGDVQHWWLPPHGAGLRTRMVDDRLWLPYVTAHYVAVTGDRSVLDQDIPFLDAPLLPDGQMDDFRIPQISDQQGSLFEHCARALDSSLATGPHGLPLFGTGDWNDGMNRVGAQGRGESVWMGWFLLRTISDFAPLAKARGDTARADHWRAHARALVTALETHAWDGDHWLRGWYDDGTPLGTNAASECRIDGIAQSWSVMSHAASPDRARAAMEALDRTLVDRQAQLVALLTPPFDRTDHDPGYIKGYPPGLRENGGQYTHGSVWAAIAFAMRGDGNRATELWRMLSPVLHAATPEGMTRWQVEPYIACADVYTAPGQRGRGGWTWYTGTAGWLYRAALEWILGLTVRADRCRLHPCIPQDWPEFRLSLRWHSAIYHFHVENPQGVSRGISKIWLDGAALDPDAPIVLCDDGKPHQVRVILGAQSG